MFLFWNVNRRPITDPIVKLVRNHSVDILVIAESSIVDSELLAQPNDGQTRIYFSDMILPRRVRIYHRYSPKFVRPISDRGYLAFRHFELPLCKPLLFGAVHLPSKSYESEGEQTFACTDFAREIERVETLVGHSRTVVVGDRSKVTAD